MNSFISTRNKFLKTYKLVDENTNQIDKLSNIKPIRVSVDFSKIKDEIILTEDELTTGLAWYGSFQLNDLDSRYLIFLKPYAILSTTEGFIFDNFDYTSYYWWEEYITPENNKNNLILHMRTDGYINYEYQPGSFSSNIAPIYVTAKIKLYNPTIL